MFVHFVLSTVVETLQLVLAPPSAAPKSQENDQVSHWWRVPQICLPMLSRTPPVCGYGYHGGVAFATKLAHWKSKVSQKLFKRGGHFCFFAFILYDPVLSVANPRTGSKGWSDPCKPTWLAGVQGVVPGLPGAPKQCSVFVNLWSCGASDFLSPKNIVFLSGMAALFCILVHSWGTIACHQERFRQNWWTHGSCHRSLLLGYTSKVDWQTFDLAGRFGVSGVFVNWSLWSFCCSGVFVVLVFLNCGLRIFLPASLTFFGQRATEMPGQVKNCSCQNLPSSSRCAQEFEPTHLNSRFPGQVNILPGSLDQPRHPQTSKVPGLIAKAAHGTVLASTDGS